MHHGALFMAERKNYNQKLQKIGQLLMEKRIALGKDYSSREKFIILRSDELFNGVDFISLRHLSNIELGKNWISIEKLLVLAIALEEDPIDLFAEIIKIYYGD